MTNKFSKTGFTLIEVLLVVSIIGLLTSIVLVSANITRAKARDASKQVTANQVKTALSMYNTGNASNKQMPGNYLTDDGNTYTYPNNNGTDIAFEDMSNPENPTTASGLAYNRSMQDLVDAGTISEIPHSSGGQPYGYYNYGAGTPAGVVFFTYLESPKISVENNSCSLTKYFPGSIISIPENNCIYYPLTCLEGDNMAAMTAENNLAAGGVSPPLVRCSPSGGGADYYGHTECNPIMGCLADGGLNPNCVCSPY